MSALSILHDIIRIHDRDDPPENQETFEGTVEAEHSQHHAASEEMERWVV
jgi:hypothetical protein